MYKYIPQTRSPLASTRIAQRLAEAKKVAESDIRDTLQNTAVPVTLIARALDAVYDATAQEDLVTDILNEDRLVGTSRMAGLRHNTTLAPDEITAANIAHYLEEAEQKQNKS